MRHWLRILPFTLMVLSACTSVPVTEPQRPPAPDARQQAQQFQQAKALFQQRNYAAAAALLLPLAKQGHMDAQYSLGYLYHYGQGVARDEQQALYWISTAAAQGQAQAQEALRRLDAGQPPP